MLSERLKQARESIGKTQKEMAKLAGASYRVWQDYEAGSVVPGGKIFESLSNLGFNANWLLTGKGQMKNEETSPSASAQFTSNHLDDKGFYPDSKIFALCFYLLLEYNESLQEKMTSGKHGRLLYTLWKILSEQTVEWQTEQNAKTILKALLKISDDYEIFRKLNMGHESTIAFMAFLDKPDSVNVNYEEFEQ